MISFNDSDYYVENPQFKPFIYTDGNSNVLCLPVTEEAVTNSFKNKRITKERADICLISRCIIIAILTSRHQNDEPSHKKFLTIIDYDNEDNIRFIEFPNEEEAVSRLLYLRDELSKLPKYKDMFKQLEKEITEKNQKLDNLEVSFQI